jgi:hypothetical protein
MLFSNIRQKMLIVFILLVLLINCSGFISGGHQSQGKTSLFPRHIYIPQDINLKDAAYHKSSGRYNVEWWYFDTICYNGYSIAFSFGIISKDSRGIWILTLNIYNNAELEFSKRKEVPIKDVYASEEFPFINVSRNNFMRLDRELYNSTGEWVYNISIEIDNQSAQLQFQGKSKGYMGEILRGWYGPVLPKAMVNGTLFLNGETIYVNGSGYHEHAWGITLPVWEWGWYWGKIESGSFSIQWAKMMQTQWRKQAQAAVLSPNQSEYININPENIKIKVSNYIYDHWRMIPTKFILNITDPENSIFVNVTLETINVHHEGKTLMHYYRYHVKVNGQITYGSTLETINGRVQIMEFMRFR